MSIVVSAHQLSQYNNPQAGQSGTASVVLGNDNTTVVGYNAHDADPTIHIQSSTLAARPAATATPGVQLGSLWFTNDGLRLYYSNGSVWSEAAYLSLAAGGTVSAAVTISGALTVTGLVDISGASAGQIKFPATQDASSNANTFDDYKEALANGSWTPTDSSGAGLTLTTDGCVYLKVSRLVIASFSITYPATGNGADNLIDSLPYTVLSLPTNAQLVSISFTNVGTAMTGVLSGGTTQFILRNAATGTPLTNAQLSGKIIRGTAIYLASA